MYGTYMTFLIAKLQQGHAVDASFQACPHDTVGTDKFELGNLFFGNTKAQAGTAFLVEEIHTVGTIRSRADVDSRLALLVVQTEAPMTLLRHSVAATGAPLLIVKLHKRHTFRSYG